jgi:arylsulfatase A-like enzyme
MFHPNYGMSTVFSAEELVNLWAHYAAEAELVDRWIGRVLQKVDDLDLWDDTVVVVTSDHGASLGEHGRTGKSNISTSDDRFWPIYPEVGHVPFLIAGAGVPMGQSLDLIAQPVDILPTIAELAGVKLEPECALDGRSFAGCIANGSDRHREYAVTGCFAVPDGSAGGVPREASTPFIVGGDWGYTPIGATGEPELYRLVGDPLAVEDVIVDNAPAAAEMQALLDEHLLQYGASTETVEMWHPQKRGMAVEGSWAVDYPREDD